MDSSCYAKMNTDQLLSLPRLRAISRPCVPGSGQTE